ncbi:hypothetical protein EVAR_96154_1 [Eumeta japonica]|uniref:Uncharacterized protein n=1 Tax=Eumeta variegata TaxID=151549 RepID=A0A4C1VJI4_EUMVA|nr:hypothetical protein EVAR_96154_1 [Eumeta japonica]
MTFPRIRLSASRLVNFIHNFASGRVTSSRHAFYRHSLPRGPRFVAPPLDAPPVPGALVTAARCHRSRGLWCLPWPRHLSSVLRLPPPAAVKCEIHGSPLGHAKRLYRRFLARPSSSPLLFNSSTLMLLPAAARIPSTSVSATNANEPEARDAFATRPTHEHYPACDYRVCTPGCSVVLINYVPLRLMSSCLFN